MTKQLNSQQAMAVLGISHMCLLTWRKGSTKRAPLPIAKAPKDKPNQVRFNVTQLKQWAKKHDIELQVDPETGFDAKPAMASKPGPKTAPVPDLSVARAARKALTEPKKAAKAPAKKTSKGALKLVAK